MKISIDRSSIDSISFRLLPDEQDAIPPIDHVFIKHPGVSKIDDARVAFIALLLASRFTCNVIELDGASWPAHLAASIVDLVGREMFPTPVSNTPKRILPDFLHKSLNAGESGGLGLPWMKRNELGRAVHGFSEKPDSGLLQVSTNVDLMACFLPGSELVSDLIVFASLFDAYGVESLKIPYQVGPEAEGLSYIAAQVGCSLEVVRSA